MNDRTKLRIDVVAESRDVTRQKVEESLEEELMEIKQEVLTDER